MSEQGNAGKRKGSSTLASADDVIAWLMDGDPAIRWQTLRHLLDAPSYEWQAE